MSIPGDFETSSAEQTEATGRVLAELLSGGDVVMLAGDLGAGKTTFARGVCRGLGIEAKVTSPTFTIARRYDDGRLPVSHLDLWRLIEGPESEDPGLLEGEAGPDRVTLVEWPEMAGPDWLPARWTVKLEHAGGDARRISIR